MSYLWFDPSTYQKPASPRKIVRGQEGDEKLVEVVKIRNANDWGKAPVRKGGPRIEVTPTGGYGQQDASPTITAKFGDWLNHVKNDVEHFVEGTENENIQIAAPSNFHQVSHIGWDAKKGFDLANIPPGWKQILDQAKVQKHELQDPVVSQAIINTAVASVPPKPPARKPSLGAPAHVLPDLDHVDPQTRATISSNIAAAVARTGQQRKGSAGAQRTSSDDAAALRKPSDPKRAEVPTRTHWSHPAHALALISASYEKGWVCDLCNVPGLRGTLSWHCVSCEYDLCEACIRKPGGPSSAPMPAVLVPAPVAGRSPSPTPPIRSQIPGNGNPVQPPNRSTSPNPMTGPPQSATPARAVSPNRSPSPNPITNKLPPSATPPRAVSPAPPQKALQVPAAAAPTVARVPSPQRPAPPVPSRQAPVSVPPTSHPPPSHPPVPASRQSADGGRATSPSKEKFAAAAAAVLVTETKPKVTLSPVPQIKPPQTEVDINQQKKMMTKLASTYALIPLKPKPQLSRQKTAVLNYKNTGRLFEDDEFPPSAKILHAPQQPVVWLRPREIDPQADLFIDGADAQDVQQGILGDCWFVGSLSVVVSRPKLFAKLYEMNREDELKAGAYAFKFYKFGTWHEVVIDDRLPCDPQKRTPLYSSSKNKREMWVSLIEKAYAKWHGGYANILGGFVSKALMDLTGGVPSKFHLDEMQKEIKSGKLWDMILQFHKLGCIMGCAYNPPAGVKAVERKGILPEHAYGIMDVRVVNDKRLIKCRNPWGSGEWTGDYSDNSPLWTSRIAEAVSLEKADDGVFWMKYEDFCAYFNRLYTCRIFADDLKVSVESEWKGVSAGGCLNYATWRNNPQFMLQVREKGVPAVILEQEILERDVNNVPSISFTIVKAPKSGGLTLEVDEELSDLEFTNNATVETELPLEPGWYHILPQTFKPGSERRFVLSVYGIRATLQPLPPDTHKKSSLKGQWKGKTAGGCRNNKTWKENPRVKLQLSAADEVFLVLAQSDKKEKNAIGTYVFEDADMSKLVTKSDFVKGIESTLRFSVASAKTLYLLPCTMTSGIDDTFVLEVFTFKPTTISFG